MGLTGWPKRNKRHQRLGESVVNRLQVGEKDNQEAASSTGYIIMVLAIGKSG